MSGPERLARRPGPTTRVRVREHLAADSPDDPSGDSPGGSPGGVRREDRVITEEPLEVRLAWPGRDAHRVWVTMRTPGHDFELAAGWVVHEGLATAPQVHGIAYCTDETLSPAEEFNVVTVTLDVAPPREPGPRSRALSAGSSACGVCGADTLDDALAVAAAPQARWSGEPPDPAVVRALPDRLRAQQRQFDRTGGVHAAGLATAAGELLVVREDVGRHNAVDKVTGARALQGEPVAGAILVVSGRAGFELVQKAVAAGTGALVAVGAPTSLARDLAIRSGLALFGFTSARRTVQYA